MFNVLSFLSFTKQGCFFFIVVSMSSCSISIDKIERIIYIGILGIDFLGLTNNFFC